MFGEGFLVGALEIFGVGGLIVAFGRGCPGARLFREAGARLDSQRDGKFSCYAQVDPVRIARVLVWFQGHVSPIETRLCAIGGQLCPMVVQGPGSGFE
jgi:hypothetical protein